MTSTSDAVLARDGLVIGMPEEEYHVGPELSSTGAKLILDSPARFRYVMDHGRAAKKEFDVGSAAHSKVLGVGAEIVVIPADKLATNGAASTAAAKEFIAEARAAGQIPLKQEVADLVNNMAEAVLNHPMARALLEQVGSPEASVFTTDPATGVRMRGRFDFLPQPRPDRGRICLDLKSIGTSASPSGFSVQAARMGYDVQQGHYLDILDLITGEADASMVFVVVETAAPHLVGVHQLDRDFADMGHAKARRARELFARATETGEWPGYSDEITLAPPPMWALYEYQDNFS